MKFRLLVHAEKQLLADAERDKSYFEPKTSKVAIPPDKPEDWPRVFEQHLNAVEPYPLTPQLRCAPWAVAARGERKQIPSSKIDPSQLHRAQRAQEKTMNTIETPIRSTPNLA